MTARTRKPCHGCGKEGLRDATSVCRDCRLLLGEATTARKRDTVPEYEHYWHHDVPHWNGSYVHGPAHYASNTGPSVDSLLWSAFISMIESISTPLSGRHYPNQLDRVLAGHPEDRSISSSSAVVYRLLITQRDAVAALDVAVQSSLKTVYAAGFYDGSNLVGQLQVGKLGLEEFNERRDARSKR